MGTNTNKRIPVKWIRDKAKSAYQKQDQCFVCGVENDLELHHLGSVTLLLERWCRDRGLVLRTDDDVLNIRDEFIENHQTELYKDVYTLCNHHHVLLHSVFGKAPPLSSVAKQRNWIEIQKNKKTDKIVLNSNILTFSSFYGNFESFKPLYEKTNENKHRIQELD